MAACYPIAIELDAAEKTWIGDVSPKLVADGADLKMVGADLIVPDGKTVRPENDQMASLGAAGKVFLTTFTNDTRIA